MPKKPTQDGYNLRSRAKKEEDDSDSDYEPPKKTATVIKISIPKRKRDDDEEDEVYQELLELLAEQAEHAAEEDLKLEKQEQEYLQRIPKHKRKEYLSKLESISKVFTDQDVPYKFRVLDMPISDTAKALVLRKVDMLYEMGLENGEAHKLRAWIDTLMRIPFGKTVPLPVTIRDGKEKCVEFVRDAVAIMDKAVYGMVPAKVQVQQILAQWISNPQSTGNVIALKGPMGVGKTSFARNGIANVLKRPFVFFSLGGASDIANFVGHAFTYEGSMHGQIVDAVIRAGCMNPVFYFDELDKISTTPHGEEIVSMLIHLTDRSQNMHFHDRYFAGLDFDLSQCLFVFSYNDESKVHPVLRDRMNVIQCDGYSEEQKKIILSKYIWESVLERVNVNPSLITLQDDAVTFLIREYSKNEEGVRNLIRAVETVITRANLLYISQNTDYPFYVPISFPMKIDKKIVEKLLSGFGTKEVGAWVNMYT